MASIEEMTKALHEMDKYAFVEQNESGNYVVYNCIEKVAIMFAGRFNLTIVKSGNYYGWIGYTMSPSE